MVSVQNSALWQFVNNKVVVTCFLGWFTGQTVKVLLGVIREKRFNFKWFVGTGGMPSAHAAGATALAASIGIQEGVGTPLFAMAAFLAVVVIFDAQGVRRATGKQAEILNKMLDDIYFRKHVGNDRLKELVGHTPIEVWIGLLIGLLVAFVSYAL